MPFAVATDMLFNEARNDGRQGPRGTWTLESGAVTSGHLSLHFVIEPPPHELPVRSGPAVVFAGLEAFGGAGDVAMGELMPTVAHTVLPACDDNDCSYVADIELPTGEIPGAVRRLQKRGDLAWISVNLTLVRTFGAGRWLQVLPLEAGPEGTPIDGRAGRLGAIEPVSGTLFPYGLFPADRATVATRGDWMVPKTLDYARVVETLRRKTDDPSVAIPTGPATLQVEIDPVCSHAAHLTLHDDAGDRVFFADVFDTSHIEGQLQLPTSTIWHLTLEDSGGIDFDQGRQGWGVRVGDIESDGSPIAIIATFDCASPAGSVISPASANQSPGSAAAPSAAAFSSAPRSSAAPLAQLEPAATGTASPLLVVGLAVVAVVGIAVAAAARRRDAHSLK